MGKYRFEARVHWSRDKQYAKVTNIPIEYYTAGDLNVPPSMRSDYASDLPALAFMEEVMDQTHMFSISLPLVHASKFSRPNWECVEIILGAYQGKMHLRSIACSWPTRKLSMTQKGMQLMTFVMENGPNQFVP